MKSNIVDIHYAFRTYFHATNFKTHLIDNFIMLETSQKIRLNITELLISFDMKNFEMFLLRIMFMVDKAKD